MVHRPPKERGVWTSSQWEEDRGDHPGPLLHQGQLSLVAVVQLEPLTQAAQAIAHAWVVAGGWGDLTVVAHLELQSTRLLLEADQELHGAVAVDRAVLDCIFNEGLQEKTRHYLLQ